MAKPGSLPVGRYFLALTALFAVLYAIVFWPGHKHTPHLGLDLVGGTQVIFTAKTQSGGTPPKSSMEQAKEIITERVNGSGVTEATVVIQGSNQIVVSIPGDTNVDPSSLGATAKLNFRGVIMPPVPVTCTPAAAGKSGSSSAPASKDDSTGGLAGDAYDATRLTGPHAAQTPAPGQSPAPSAAKSPDGSAGQSPAKSPAAAAATPTPAADSSSSAPQPCSLSSVDQLRKQVKSLPDPAPAEKGKSWTSPVYKSNGLSASVSQAVSAKLANFDCGAAQDEPDRAKDYYIVCDGGKNAGQPLAFLLGPIIVPGTGISSASAAAPNVSQGQIDWAVNVDMKSSAQKAWAKYTAEHNVGGVAPTAGIVSCGSTGTPCTDYVAFTLDGQIVSNPYNNSVINRKTTQISGSFDQDSANQLAQQLKYGALPLNFKAETAQTISATLGTSQLKAGMLAGGIGLVLVVVYSLLYYRALGLVTIASLIVSGGLVYGSIVMLGSQMGFTLSLAGIAGFIVAVGITTDSFVVFFERIKDEVHEGRSVRVAIPRAWIRARRTILSADTVSVLAAAILYYFAAGDVKGFAFTLGLSTILDIAVVFLFTHPLMSLLSRMKAFGTGRFTGLAHIRDGMVVTAPPSPRRSPRRAEPRSPEPPEPADSDDSAEAADRSEPPGGGVQLSKSPVATLRHTTPEPGSAAERAAARRARMREKGER